MMALLSLTALARPAMTNDLACALATLQETVPADGATDVAIDLMPVLIYQGACGFDGPQVVRLHQGETLVFEATYDRESFDLIGDHLLLSPDWGPLEPDTAYRLEVTSEFGNTPTDVGFTTGTRTAASLAGLAPSLTIDDATMSTISRHERQIDVALTLDSANGEAGLFIVREGSREIGAFTTAAGTGSVSTSWWVGERQPEVCLTAVQRDEAGNWHGPSDEVCAKLTGSGCSHVPTWPAAVLFLPVLGAVRRRR